MSSSENRPMGIVILVVLWVLGSIYNLVQGLYGIVSDIGVFPLLSDPYMPEWFRIFLPTEMLLAFFMVIVAFFSFIAVYGLLTAKSWSYHLALALPVFAVIIYIASAVLDASVPAEVVDILEQVGFTVGEYVIGNVIRGFVSLVVVGVTWIYLTQVNIKRYLNQIPTSIPEAVPVPPSELPVPPPPTVSVTMSFEKKFCRYCGAENKTDADFCEKCGKKIG